LTAAGVFFVMRLKADAANDVVQARLVLKYLQLRATFGWSFSNLVELVRMNLFASRDLWTWLADPFTPRPLPPSPVQTVLAFA
jgi:hypothetical protein